MLHSSLTSAFPCTFYSNDDAAAYNHQELLKLSQPVACIQARHSSCTAKSLPSDEMSGLVPILFLARNASVMLTMNLWPELGLCNGATGKVVDIIFAENHSPPDLQIAVMVKFDYYTKNVYQCALSQLHLIHLILFMKDGNYL